MSLETKIEALTAAVQELIATMKQAPAAAASAPAPVAAPVLAAPAPAVAMPAPPTFQPVVAPTPAVAAPTAPFSDPKGLIDYVMSSYKALGAQKGAQIQQVLVGLGYQNINDVKPEHYGALFAGVEALK
jgi:hypothetical protein